MARDDFTKRTVATLAKRAGFRCSKCKSHTVGPATDPEGTVMVGVAAHVRAASKGGARHDASMTTAQRQHIRNGIWLCQVDAKLIDDDESEFTVAVLEKMKAAHEAEIGNLVSSGRSEARPSDAEILDEFAAVLDRPALTEPFAGCVPGRVQKAISDIIETLNTGVHRLRDGTEIQRIASRHFLRDSSAREAMDEIIGLLGDLRGAHGKVVGGDACSCAIKAGAAPPLDRLREQILDTFRRVKPDFTAHVRVRRW